MHLRKIKSFIFRTEEHPEFTIITCHICEDNYNRLKEFFLNFNFKSRILKSELRSLKWMVALHKPKFIVTDNCFWEESDAFTTIEELRLVNSTPLIIWSDAVSENILDEALKYRYVYHIDHENDMKWFWNTTSRIAY